MFDIEAALKEFSRFNSYVVDVSREIQLFEQIYCSDDSAMLNQTKLADVFGIIQRSMFISILTRVAALFDSKACRGDKNLSVAHLASTYEAYETQEVRDLRLALLEKYTLVQIKDFRNKLIAHNDLATVIGDNSVSHNIKSGDLMDLMSTARDYAIALCRCTPGGMSAVLQVTPWALKLGRDGHELLRLALWESRA